MLHLNFLEILTEFGLTYLFILVFILIGHWFLKLSGANYSSVYGNLFKKFLSGILLTVSLYSIVVAKGVTINIFLLPLLYLLFVRKKSKAVAGDLKVESPMGLFVYAELALIILLSIFILHLFPESEYKQADSFFYLKISESLNATGQENINHYFNSYNPAFHGAEPYHYFELWLTAMIIRVTEGFYPSINAERFVMYGIFLSGIILGLYFLVEEVLNKKITWYKKIFCWSLVFFLPNFLNFFPQLHFIFISDFEGNILERPNFRIIYLLLIPVFTELNTRDAARRWIYLLLILSVISFVCAAVILPSLVAWFLWMKISSKARLDIKGLGIIVAFTVLLASFYFFFGIRKLPTLYNADWKDFALRTMRGYRFIAYSIATSVLYVLILAAIFLLPFYFFKRNAFLVMLKSAWTKYRIIALIGFMGLVFARILYQKDNAYQFIFISHIIVTLFVWLVILMVMERAVKQVYLIASLFIASLFIVKAVADPKAFFTNTFSQNGNFVYEGKKYSQEYLNEVSSYFKSNEHAIGGYIADTFFYKNTYYSRRNPNVYFLPVTYIMAKQVNKNFEFCLSDPSQITTGIRYPLEADYLKNAISRSFFYQYQLAHPQTNYLKAVAQFIDDYKLKYLLVTKEATLDSSITNRAQQIQDINTGERLLILGNPR